MFSEKKPVILIVDDNEKNLQFLGKLLEDYDYQLFFAKNGKHALQFIEEHKPDLILLDIMMPELNGFEVCSVLKNDPNTKDIPILFLTAKTEMEDILRGFEVGGSDYITKPFNSKELIARIKAHLELKLAKEELSILRRMVTICSNCKAVKNENGEWEQMETFISRKTDIDFSHGLCPECFKKLYPEIADKSLKKKKH